MKNLKLSLLTLMSVISFGLMSQTMVYTTNTSSPNVCDGTAMLDTNINFSVINWQGMGMIIQSGGYYVDSLCPGTYTVSFVMNNFPTTLTFNIGYDTTTNYGDTLVITNTGACTNPLTTFNVLAEDCTINFNTIDTVYMTIDSFINSGLDSILCVWYVIDTTGAYQTYMVNYPMIDSTGCYNFQLTVYCYNKTSGYKTIIINQTENVGFAGINELSMNKRKLIKVIDMMGNETKLESNRFLIKCYDDGTTEKVFQTNK
jgi:hypothetical protein